MENNNEKQKLQEAGAFWVRKSKSGNSFLSGAFKTQNGEEVKVLLFKNSYKTEGSNQPDYRAYFDTNTQNGTTQAAPKKVKASEPKKEATPQVTEEIPF